MKLTKLTLIGLLLTMCSQIFAQFQQKPIPIDSTVRYGKLSNGLTYYIKHNEEPKERAEFHIAQNVGSILEMDNQNGLAHFLEHMAFNGTKNFPDKAIINYFEKIGVKFGYDINAYTSLDETVYRLSNVPTQNKAVLDTALLVLHDWSGFITLKGEEIDKERGVIREEWRTGNNAQRRLLRQTNKEVYAGSQYAKRDVIGDTAIINNFSYKALKDYYKKWYRPDQQAIVIVGDVDVDRMEKKIKSMFSDIPRKDNFGERPIYNIPDNKEPIMSIVTDKEAGQVVIKLEWKKNILPKEIALSNSGYFFSTVNRIISSMLNSRFEEIVVKPTSPFAVAYGAYGNLVKSKDAFNLIALAKEGNAKDALNALLFQGEKMKRFGFTNSELERAKTNIMAGMEKQYNERNNIDNQRLANEYIRNFLDNEPIPGIAKEYELIKEILPIINLQIVNSVSKSYITNENLIVSITAPEKETLNLPSKAEIKAAIDNMPNLSIEPNKEEVINKSLMKTPTKIGTIESIKQNKILGNTELTLSNGIKILIKPTTFKKDEIRMNAYSYGGVSKIHNIKDIPSAMFAPMVVSTNGIGEFNAIDLGKVLTGKNISVSPYISTYTEGINGSSTIKDFETFLQLVNLNFTSPRKDNDAFQALLSTYKTMLANAESNPNKAFSDSVSQTMSDHDPRNIIQSSEMIKQIDQDKALEIYKQRFANPADFTFVFVGNIDPNDAKIQKLLATYLGSLNTQKGEKESYDNVYKPTPKGKIKNYFTKEMKTRKASNRIQYTQELPYTMQNTTTLVAIAEILTMRYMESIREDEGGSYGVSVGGVLSKIPEEKARIIMQFDTDPEKQVKLMEIIHKEVAKIIADGPKAEDLLKVKENMLKEYSQDIKNNRWWMSALINYYKDGMNYKTDYETTVNALNADLIQKTLKEIAASGDVIEVVMMPK